MEIVRGGIAPAALAAVAAMAGAQPRAATPRSTFVRGLIRAAVAQTADRVTYDGSYRRIGYPGGDVPSHIGVCTDLVVRAYRAVGIDLQVRVHEDMTAAFASEAPERGRRRAPRHVNGDLRQGGGS